MNIRWEETGNTGVCYAAEGDQRLAAIHYTWSGQQLMVVDRFDCAYPDAVGLLQNMVDHLVENARMLGSRIIPLIDPVMEILSQPTYRDVLYLKEKARGGVLFPGHPYPTRELFR
ncbi:MAG: hypothetical protein ACK57D_11760 [Sphingobacteriales bacterium]|jgi:hypothetical protein